jgi:hypothetical protein
MYFVAQILYDDGMPSDSDNTTEKRKRLSLAAGYKSTHSHE